MPDEPRVLDRNAWTKHSNVKAGPKEAEEGVASLTVEPETKPNEARTRLGGRWLHSTLLSIVMALCLCAGCYAAMHASLRRHLLSRVGNAALPSARASPNPATMGNASKSLTLYGKPSKTRKPTQKPHRKPKPSPLKLLINSHVKYQKPLAFLLKSMVNASFDRWQDVMIVFGGSTADIGPHKAVVGGVPVTIVNTTLNAYDYTALWAIWRYRNHHMAKADRYFYLLDSSSVGPYFSVRFKEWSERNGTDEVLVRPWGYNSNLCIFSRRLVSRFRASFRLNFTKTEAVRLEIMDRYNARGARPLIWWAVRTRGRIVYTPPRDFKGFTDVYGIGFSRMAHWYPNFDVSHYMLHGGFGDLQGGGVKPIDMPPLTPQELAVPP